MKNEFLFFLKRKTHRKKWQNAENFIANVMEGWHFVESIEALPTKFEAQIMDNERPMGETETSFKSIWIFYGAKTKKSDQNLKMDNFFFVRYGASWNWMFGTLFKGIRWHSETFDAVQFYSLSRIHLVNLNGNRVKSLWFGAELIDFSPHIRLNTVTHN